VITDVQTSKGSSAITSDQWHIVHSRLVDAGAKRPYVRSIHSEYADGASCRKAARALRARLAAENPAVPAAERDEFYACRPRFKSLKRARTRRADA
jgi:hypothetical protein